MVEVNNGTFIVANATSTTFELQNSSGTNIDTTTYTAYTSGGTVARIYQITTPYATADLFELKFEQNADVVTIVHETYRPYELKRTGDTSWTLTEITFNPTIETPGNFSDDDSGTGGSPTTEWNVTAVDRYTGEESLPASTSSNGPTPSYPITLTWNPVTDATKYRIYKKISSGLLPPEFLAEVTSGVTTYVDDNSVSVQSGIFVPQSDFGPLDTYEINTSAFPATFTHNVNNPTAVAQYQQRRVFAKDESISASYIGEYASFWSPLVAFNDSSPVNFTLAGKEVSTIRHLLDVGRLLVFTKSSEWEIRGDAQGVLTPTAINARQHTYHGASHRQPIVIDGIPIYVQERGSTVRDIAYNFDEDGYRGDDLTNFNYHLVEGRTIDDWAYQKNNHSIVWMVRSDGTLLGLTYIRNQKIVGWHRHDTNGSFESVCVVPEGTEDALYVSVKRTIDGRTVRYIERMQTRFITDDEVSQSAILDNVFSGGS
jgi:hypothetical protein